MPSFALTMSMLVDVHSVPFATACSLSSHIAPLRDLPVGEIEHKGGRKQFKRKGQGSCCDDHRSLRAADDE